MESDISYIDKVIDEGVGNLTQTAKTDWAKFHSNNTNTITPNTNITPLLGKASIVGLTVTFLVAGVFMYNENNTHKRVTPVFEKNTKLNYKKTSRGIFKLNENKLTKNKSIKDTTNLKERDVIIKINVPIHKKVIIKKEIKITDSVE